VFAVVVGLAVARIAKSDEVLGMVVRLVVIDVMTSKGAAAVSLVDATELTGIVVSLTDLLFESFRKLTVVFRVGGVWEATGQASAGDRTILAPMRPPMEKVGRPLKGFAALFTDECGRLLSASCIVARRRAMLTAALGYLRTLDLKLCSAMLANLGYALVAPIVVALARAEAMLLRLRVIRMAVDWLSAVLARLSPAAISAGVRAETGLAFLDFVEASRELFATPFAGALDAGDLGNSHARARAELATGGGGRFKAFTANLTDLEHGEIPSVWDDIRSMVRGRWLRRASLSAGSYSAQALTPVYHSACLSASGG